MKVRFFFSAVLFVLSILLVNKGFELQGFSADVDGDGIGLYLGPMTINERVPEEQIPYYAKNFFIAGFLTFIIAFIPLLYKAKRY